MNVLFVCTGNICRSPLAEGILRDKFKQFHLQGNIDSCGFESFHVGDRPDNRAQSVARNHGLDISNHRSRLFRISDFDHFDKIYVMDSTHYHNVMRYARSESDRQKVDYIMNVLFPGSNVPVRDPWYDDIDAFEKVYAQLDSACESVASIGKTGNR